MDITKILNKILATVTFLYALIIYIITMAPTTSFWDCGEFIACSVTLGVPHPPGTPLFLLLGNVFSNIPIFSDIGARVNLISPIASAFSVMFLYLIIIQLIERILKNKEQEERDEHYLSKKIRLAQYCAFIAAITFALTDSQWFNAVESEVYALSTFFTAIVIWLILKWAQNFNNSSQIKYLILISYCIGLAIGVHLLNLLAIPFIGLIIFFKFSDISQKKFVPAHIATFLIGTGLSFLIIYKGIIKGLPSIANKMSDPIILYLFFVVTIIATIISNIRLKDALSMNNASIIKHITMIVFTFFLLFITVNELFIQDYQELLNTKNQEIQNYSYHLNEKQADIYEKFQLAPNEEAKTFYYMDLIQNGIKSDVANWVITNAQTQIDTYSKGSINYFNLLSTQTMFNILKCLVILILGISSLFLFQKKYEKKYYKISRLIISCTMMILLGYSTYSLIFIRAQQNPKINYNNPHDIKSAYQYINRDQYGQWSILDRKTSLIINSQGNNESWKRYTQDPKNVTNEEITKFVWDYQFKEMYLRYFSWQFIGKESWLERSWQRNSLNGTPLITMRPLQGVDFWRYGLPIAFIIGLFGIFYHFKRDPKRALSVLTLFILTGLAVVVYLNQSDPEQLNYQLLRPTLKGWRCFSNRFHRETALWYSGCLTWIALGVLTGRAVSWNCKHPGSNDNLQ